MKNEADFRGQQDVHPGGQHGGIRLLQGARSSEETPGHPREDRLSSHSREIRFERSFGKAELSRRAGEIKLSQPVEPGGLPVLSSQLLPRTNGGGTQGVRLKAWQSMRWKPQCQVMFLCKNHSLKPGSHTMSVASWGPYGHVSLES